MSTWTSPSKSTVEQEILAEDGFSILAEDGFIMLQENDKPDWSEATKNTPSWSSGGSKSNTSWSSPTKN